MRAGRKHLVAMEEEVAGFVEGNAMRCSQKDAVRGADGGDGGIDSGGIDCGRFVSGKTEKDGTIGAVTKTSKRQ
jgi:hypothetical protein